MPVLGVLGDPTFPAGGPLATSGSDGHDGRYCGSIYFRCNCTVTIGSTVVSVQLDCDCDFLHLRRVNWSVNCFKKAFRPSIVVLLDETFDSTRPQAPSVSELFCHTCGDPAARLVPFQPMAHGSTL